ncbi:Hypothetical predicted protein [Marmota monax]|uniref:Uncharacterized protein n=1 Tax=Marmota monax TaxID=9995 RepID=A0A5E4BJ37_MARMO|nr:Hypothetical predicted protein [Marmota monax]
MHLPCLAFGHVVFSGKARGEGSFPHHFARPPPRPTPDCAVQAAAGWRGLWIWTQGGCDTHGSEVTVTASYSSHPSLGVEPHWGHSGVPSSQNGLCMDMAGPYGSQAISSPSSSALGDPLMHRGAREGPYLGGQEACKMGDGLAFLYSVYSNLFNVSLVWIDSWVPS